MPTALILDTDIDTDCDDAGTLALLHAAIGDGRCDLRGVVCSAPVAACPGAVRAINAWYGRPGIPVGAVRVPDHATAPQWQAYRTHRGQARITTAGGSENGTYADLLARTRPPGEVDEDAVALYRRLLAAAAPGELVVCGIGTLTALAQLLRSGPDAHSPLRGRELVARAVRELVVMAIADHPTGADRFNWRMDLPSAAAVLRDWPTLLTVSSAGQTVLTGARFMAAAPPGHPVRVAYLSFLGDERKTRPSWDQLTAWYAVDGLAGPFALSGPQRLDFDAASGAHTWTPGAAGPGERRKVVPLADDAHLAGSIETAMIVSLGTAAVVAGNR